MASASAEPSALRDARYAPRGPSSGAEAIERFRANRPDVTLMDLQMPVMNGIVAITAIRPDYPGSRFIILATY